MESIVEATTKLVGPELAKVGREAASLRSEIQSLEDRLRQLVISSEDNIRPLRELDVTRRKIITRSDMIQSMSSWTTSADAGRNALRAGRLSEAAESICELQKTVDALHDMPGKPQVPLRVVLASTRHVIMSHTAAS